MNLIDGITYNFRGLFLGIKTPKLLFWGLLRFVIVILITIFSVGLILTYHQEILNIIWAKPASRWIIWLWYLLSWILTLCLVGLASVISYLVSQILFSVVIMDHMSCVTELRTTGKVEKTEGISFLRSLSHLIRQEIPRTTFPVLLAIILMIAGWFTPLGLPLAIFSSGIAVVFLAWDNTDLLPARQRVPFKVRFRYLLKTIPFHLGFGLPFLIPGLNMLLLSFAPVGATLYQLEKNSDPRQQGVL